MDDQMLFMERAGDGKRQAELLNRASTCILLKRAEALCVMKSIQASPLCIFLEMP